MTDDATGAGSGAVGVRERAEKIRLFMFDVDGVLTDGRIIYDNYADELKFFDVQDGFGLYLLHQMKIPVVVVTAKKSRLVKMRAKDMRVTRLYQGAHDKLKVYEQVKRRFRLTDEEICFVGDDLVDLPVMRRVGLACAVPAAVDEVRDVAQYLTIKAGGRGAVREVVELVLRARGLWESATAFYRR